MPWVRIDENAMDHPKIGGLPDGAFRLWVQALAYCQKYLTDGDVSAVALKGLRSYSPARRAVLLSVGLWIDTTTGGITVHDYLQWNDSRAQVQRSRQLAKERIQKLRGRLKAGNAVTSHEHTHTERSSVSGGVCSSYLKESKNGKTISTAEGVAAFDRFWTVYPRKESQRAAEDQWRASKIDQALEAVILADIRKRVGLGWATEPRFVPHAARYLAERMWQEQFTPRLAPKPARPESDGRVVPGAEETRRKLAELQARN